MHKLLQTDYLLVLEEGYHRLTEWRDQSIPITGMQLPLFIGITFQLLHASCSC